MTSARERTCLVIGGHGFIGSAIVREAEKRGYDTVAAGRAEYASLAGTSCDLLINANGNSRKYLSDKDPVRDYELSVLSVMRTLHDFKTRHYVHLSSIDVYPDARQPATAREETVIDPARLSRYGFHKYLAEQLVRYYAPSWLILRMGGSVGTGLWKNSIYDMLTGAPLRVHPDSVYQYLNTRDMAAMLFDLVEQNVTREVINVTGDGVISLREAAEWIPGYPIGTVQPNVPTDRYEVDVSKLKSYGDVPTTRETIRAFIGNVQSGGDTLREESR